MTQYRPLLYLSQAPVLTQLHTGITQEALETARPKATPLSMLT